MTIIFFRNKNTASEKPIKIFKIKEMYDVLLGGKSRALNLWREKDINNTNSMKIRFSYGVSSIIYRVSNVYLSYMYRVCNVVDSVGVAEGNRLLAGRAVEGRFGKSALFL